MSDDEEFNKAHTARVVDDCYGWTGGVMVRCSCGSYWVLGRNASEHQISESIMRHRAEAAKAL